MAVKDKQLENKDLQITQMQSLLDQQQRLSLQDKKLLEEYKLEINELKSLMIPTKKNENGRGLQSHETVDNSQKDHKRNKKWYRF